MAARNLSLDMSVECDATPPITDTLRLVPATWLLLARHAIVKHTFPSGREQPREHDTTTGAAVAHRLAGPCPPSG
ncbi:hypothetical protein CMUS01_08881 [Colletotrichum musicola]|uniref:Uncharacterized protein n=1 Tax=Colletotrichum musicola TaxID=2175873 RepID=A0A8H6KAD8_9PEZI|nr:hypothetical protein CMUS01_08881 [Colletotrichum musicola]